MTRGSEARRHPPFFIVGFQRSGTTLLRLMLDNHPEVAVPLDTVGLWARYEARLGDYRQLRSEEDREALVRDLLAEERIALWSQAPDAAGALEASDVLSVLEGTGYPSVIEAFYRAYARSRGKSRWGDKDPGNMARIHRIDCWFPEARIVHLVRDGRDACLSQKSQDFGYDELLPCAAGWREEVCWVRRTGQILGPERYFELRYEDLLGDPEAELRSLCAFLNLEYDGAMLRYHENVAESVPDEKRDIWPLIDRPPRPSNAEKWKRKMSRGMRTCFEKRAGGVLAECGYDVLPGTPSGAYLTELRALVGGAWRAVRRRLGG